MTNAPNWGQAGLVFLKQRDIDIAASAHHVCGAFQTMGHHIAAVHILSDTSAQVSTDTHDLTLNLQENVQCCDHSDAGQMCLTVTLCGTTPDPISRFSRDAILARCLQQLNAALAPDFVQWQDAAFLLPSDSFAAATQGEKTPSARPPADRAKPATSHRALPDVETTNAVIQDRISNQDPQIFDAQSSPERLREMFSDGWVDPTALAADQAADAVAREMEDIEHAAPLRLSAWFMSFAVVLIALPIGVALLIVNMAKGENLRLSSQTAALTGTFVAFQAMGTTAHAMAALQQIIQ